MEHLTHGWEPELGADDSLLRRFVLTLADHGEEMARAIDGRARRTDVLSMADPASPVMFDNAVTVLQPSAYADVEAALADAIAWYPADRHFVVLSPFPTPDFAPLGLELMGHPPLMLRAAGGEPPPPPDGLTVRPVSTADELAEFVDTIVEAYPMPGAETSGLADPRVLDTSIRLYTGYVGDVPVGTAGVRLGHGLNDVEWVSTHPDHRRRGIGAALTWAATLAEPSEPAALIASDDGQGVYESMGYVRIMRLTMWHRPPAG